MQVRGFFEDESSALIDADTWISDNERVASIDNSGLAEGLADGSATLFATVGELGARTTVRVREPSDAPVTVVAVPAQLALAVGETSGIAASATYEDGQTGNIAGQCGWSTSDAAIATVTDGLVTAVRPGQATITIDCGPRSPSPVPVVVRDETQTIDPPDLAITYFDASVVGGVARYDVVVTNSGSGAAGGFWVDLFANSAAAPTADSPLDDLAWVPELAAGASLPLQLSVTGLGPGTLQSWVSADLDDRIAEASETNNLGGPVSVTLSAELPDLSVQEVAALTDGSTTYYEATIVNGGSSAAAGFWVDLFIDPASPPVVDDTGDDFVWVDALAPGSSVSVEFLIDDAPATAWTSVVFADTNAMVDESDETNNQATAVVSE